MEFKTRVGVGALTGAGETGCQFAWQERVVAEGVRELEAVVAAIEAGIAALRWNECSHEHGCSRSSRQLLARARVGGARERRRDRLLQGELQS